MNKLTAWKEKTVIQICFLLYYVNYSASQDLLIHDLRCGSANSPSVINVGSGGAGIIRHNSSESSTECRLTLLGSSQSGYVTLVGVTKYGCGAGDAAFTIRNTVYCDSKSTNLNFVVINLGISELNISTSGNSSAFSFTYYFRVVLCGENTMLGNVSLDGTISPPNPSINLIGLHPCNSIISSLPQNAPLRFELLNPKILNGHMIKIGERDIIRTTDHIGTVVEVQSSPAGTIPFACESTTDADEDSASLRFMIRYSVLRCANPPMIENAVFQATNTSYYLPNSSVKYQCLNNYQHNDKSYITCERNGDGATWTNDVKCIVVPWCTEKSQEVENSIQTQVSPNRTIEYTCEEGYESPNGTDSVLVFCSTPNNETVPWTWNDTHITGIFRCTPVQCNVTELSTLANVTISTTKETVNYTETVDFECDEGFTKLTEDLACQSDKTWSKYQLCKEVQCNLPEFINANASSSPLTSLPYRTVLNISCDPSYQLLNGGRELSIICNATGSWNVTLPNNPISGDGVVRCEKIPGTTGTEPQEAGTGPAGLTEMQITLIASVPTGVLFITAVVIVAVCCVRKNQNQPSESKGKSDTEGYVNNHSIGAYDTVELETPSGPAANGFKKSSNKPSKKSKIKTNGTAVAESSANGAGPNDLYTAVTPKMKPKKTKPNEPPTAAEPIYEAAPPVPVKHHGGQEPDLVENDLYEQAPGNAAGYATGADDVKFVDNDIYDQSGPPPMQSSDIVAFVDNDLYDYNP